MWEDLRRVVILLIGVVEVGVWVGNRGVVCVWLVVIMYGAGAGRASPHWECLAGECPAMGRSRGGCRLVACAYADVRLTERERVYCICCFAIANWFLLYAIRVVCVEAVIISVDSVQHSFATGP